MRRLLSLALLLCLLSLARGALLNPGLEGEDAVASLDSASASHASLSALFGAEDQAVSVLEQESALELEEAQPVTDAALLEQERLERSTRRTSSPYTHELRASLAMEARARASADANADAEAELDLDAFDGPMIERMEGPESAAEILRHLEPLLQPRSTRLGREDPASQPSMPLLSRVEQRRLRTQHMNRVLQAKYARQQARRGITLAAHAGSKAEGGAKGQAEAETDADAEGISAVSEHEVVKSSEDDRSYRFVTLSNGLRAVLVSDPNTTKSAAAMDVGNGYLSDPPSIPGMAHFLEHMLFLGTEKYPSESAYADFIEAHGGFSNAYTGMENTNYYFDILPAHLEGALDRFAQFFISPLLNVNSTGREMRAVDSEHSKNLLSDNWRTHRLMQALANQSHPYAKFGTGCAQTLDVMPHEEMQRHLRDFWTKHYTAPNLFLSVIGTETLDQLQAMVDAKFAAVPKGKGTYNPLANTHHSQVFNASVLGSQVFVNTIEDTRFLSLIFPAEGQYKHYKQQAVAFLRTLVEGRGPHSLLKQLKNRGWATAVQLGIDAGTSQFAVLSFSVELTQAGTEHVDEIVAAFFAKLALIRREGLQQWRFDEMQRIANLTFTYKDKEQPSDYISKLAANLRRYPPEHVLIAGRLFLEYSQKHLLSILDTMKPANMILMLGGKQLRHQMRFKERWYGIEYDVLPLEKARLRGWEADNAERQVQRSGWRFELPGKSPFIPKELKVQPPLLNPVPYPIVLRESGPNATAASRLWFSEDLEFHRPQAHAVFRMYVPHLYSSPRSYLLTNIYASLLEEQLDEQLYAALLAGFSAHLRVGTVYVDLVFSGFNSGLLNYAGHVARILNPKTGFKPDPRRFEVLKETLATSYLNKKYEAPHRQSSQLLNSLLDPRLIPHYDLVRTLQTLSYEDVVRWPQVLFADMSLEAYVHGNVAPGMAGQLLDLFENNCPFRSTSSHFHRSPSRNHLVPRARLGQVKEDVAVRMRAPNPAETNSAVVKYWQYGLGGIEGKLYSQLLAQMAQKPIFHQLRTTEQLGYIVWSSADSRLDVNGYKIQVQSGRHSAAHVSSRIDAFLPVLQARLRNLTQAQFEAHVETLMMSKLQSPVSMGVQTAWFWSEISRQEYVFQRREIELYILNATRVINRAGFEQFVQRLFYISDPKNPGLEASENRGGGVLSVQVEAPAKQPHPKETQAKADAKPAAPAAAVPAAAAPAAPTKSKQGKKLPSDPVSKLLALLDAQEQLDHVAELEERAQAEKDRREEAADRAEAERDRKILQEKKHSLLQTAAELEASLDEALGADAETDADAEDELDFNFLELHTQLEADSESEASSPMRRRRKQAGKKGGSLFRNTKGKDLSLASLDNAVTIVTRARDGGVFLFNTTQANVRSYVDSLALYSRSKYALPPPVTKWVNEVPVKTAASAQRERQQAAQAIAAATGIVTPIATVPTPAAKKPVLAVKNGKPVRPIQPLRQKLAPKKTAPLKKKQQAKKQQKKAAQKKVKSLKKAIQKKKQKAKPKKHKKQLKKKPAKKARKQKKKGQKNNKAHMEAEAETEVEADAEADE